jgi:hypothetical protein
VDGVPTSERTVDPTAISGGAPGELAQPPAIRELCLIAHVLRLQLSYLSKDQALAVADTILRTFKAARLSIRQHR